LTAVSRTRRRRPARCRRYSRRAVIISAFFGEPEALPHDVASIASEETPNMAPTT
jgi:hypothetical protein